MPSDHVPPGRESRELAAMRVAYSADEPDLDVVHVDEGWLPLVRIWLGAAVDAGLAEPNAMVLATVDEQGRPASRTVLCKGLSEEGVLLFTNYDSDKGRQLAHNPYASVTFAWIEQAHQVTLRGRAERVGADVTADYWRSRPRGSQLGAWASQQSRPIASRSALDVQLADTEARFRGGEIPVPPHWGGIVIRPFWAEFWQGRANRLHNRVRTELVDDRWVAQRLQP